MAEAKKNPLLVGLLTLIPQAISTVSSIVKDKRDRKAADAAMAAENFTASDTTTSEPKTIGGAVVDSVKEIFKGDVSSKRIMNIAGTGAIIVFALSQMSDGISMAEVAVLTLGVVYGLGMGIITYLSEKKVVAD